LRTLSIVTICNMKVEIYLLIILCKFDATG